MDNSEEIIKYRLSRSDEAFEDAIDYLKKERYTGVASRLYYSAFYAVSAYFLKKMIYSKSHSGLKSKFNEHFIKNRIIDPAKGDIYNELFDFRHDADYRDLLVMTKEDVEPLIDKANALITEIKNLIE